MKNLNFTITNSCIQTSGKSVVSPINIRNIDDIINIVGILYIVTHVRFNDVRQNAENIVVFHSPLVSKLIANTELIPSSNMHLKGIPLISSNNFDKTRERFNINHDFYKLFVRLQSDRPSTGINFTEVNLLIEISKPTPDEREEQKEICPAPHVALSGTSSKNDRKNHQNHFNLNENVLNGVHVVLFFNRYNII